uniref:Uncharacterized protein n=1 Tax=viral metagenome TaxID=1070528 RepID=A0A6H1ZVB9_9ZZZZ
MSNYLAMINKKAFSEIAIMLLSGTSIWLVNSGPDIAPWAAPFGLASQFFWIRDTYRNKEWGKFVLSLWFTAAWCRGLYRLFWG